MADENAAAVDLGKRIAAARKYRGVTQISLAKRAGIGPDTLGRYEKGRIDKSYKRDGLINATAEMTDLPHEFFSINFDDLPLMVRAWRQASRLPRPEDLQKVIDEKLNQDPPD